MTTHRSRFALVVPLTALLWTAGSALAQLPATRLGAILPAGVRAGESADVTISGADLDDVDALRFGHPGLVAKRKLAEPGPFDEGPQPVENGFVVTAAATVPPGTYEVRAVGKYGVSNPRAFVVGDRPEVIEVEPNESDSAATLLESTPVVVNGVVGRAADVDCFRFTATARQRILVVLHGQQIDSTLDGIVSVSDATGRVIASGNDDRGRDSLVDFTVPATGEYVARVRDAAYRGGPEFVYRLVIGVVPHIDFVFPPAAAAGGARPVTVYGRNLPGGRPSGLIVAGRPLDALDVNVPIPSGEAARDLVLPGTLPPAAFSLDGIVHAVKGPGGTSNAVHIGIASAPPVVEQEPNDDRTNAPPLAIPCEVMGRFDRLRDRDWYAFEATKGEPVVIEVVSQRTGIRSNPRLYVERIAAPATETEPERTERVAYLYENGTNVGGSEFDLRNGDPVYVLVPPDDGRYRVLVSDGLNDASHDPRRVYRLIVRRGAPDFRLAVVAEESFAAVLLRKGGQAGLRVVAERRDGFAGEIIVNAEGLPAGVVCKPGVIGPESTSTTLQLVAAPGAAPAVAGIRVFGTARIGNADQRRTARVGAALIPTTARQNAQQQVPAVEGRLVRDLVVAVSAVETAPVAFTAGADKTWPTSRGGRIKVPITRGGTFQGTISYVARGLPANVGVPTGNLSAATAEIQIDLQANAPVGTYTFFLDGVAQQVDYARNPEAAAAAVERQKVVDAIKLKADVDAKMAVDTRAAAEKTNGEATAALMVATTAKTTAEQNLAAARAAETTAKQAADAAKSASEANPGDAALAANVTTTAKALVDATAKVTAETKNVETATKTLETATATSKTTTAALAEATEKATATTERARLAAELKTKTDQRATTLVNAAKPQKRNVPIVSTPITIEIAPAPFTVAPLPAMRVVQGAKVELPVRITRLFAYNDPVALSVSPAPGVGGLSIPNVSLPNAAVDAKLVIEAAANATVGEHTLTLRATANLNGRSVTLEQPVTLMIEAMPPS